MGSRFGSTMTTTTTAAKRWVARSPSGLGYRQAQISFGTNVPKMFSQTPGVIRTFCEECGSSIGYADEGLHDEYWLTIGFMDNPERFEPEAHG